MNRRADIGKLQTAIAAMGILAVCLLAYFVGSGWALPGLLGVGHIVGKIQGNDRDDGV